MPTPLQNVRLLQQTSIAVRKLAGFSKGKGHYVPDRHSSATETFIDVLVADDVEREIDELFQALKERFKFKRKEISASASGGSGTIVTPQFTYNLRYRLNSQEPSGVIVLRELSRIGDPDTVCTEEFNEVFAGKFDSLEFAADEPLNLEQIVDQIEDLDTEDVSVEYNKDLTHCVILVAGSNIRLEVTANFFRITQEQRLSVKQLIQSFLSIQELLVEKYQLKHLPF